MSEVKANYSFDVQKQGNGYQYDVTPAKYGVWFGVLITFPVAVLLVMPIVLLFQISAIIGFILVIPAVMGVVWVINNKIRKPSQFNITDSKIEINGKSYDRKHVTNLYIKTPRGNVDSYSASQSNFVYAGTGMSGFATATAMNTAHTAHRAYSESLNKVVDKARFKVMIRYGDKDVKLAGGLTENSARNLYDTIVKNHANS